jgi:beta-lactamase superfamily II metal-dependent hydrolase
MNNLSIKFFPVGCGDAISIRFLGDDNKYHNILIDGGYQKMYPLGIKNEIQTIVEQNECIDLWIITHIHEDHIGAIRQFIRQKRLRKRVDISKTVFWFNYSKFAVKVGVKESDLTSVSDGIKLRDFLKEKGQLSETITNEMVEKDFYGASITILSPNKKSYDKFVNEWKAQEQVIVDKEEGKYKSSQENDYDVQINDFDLSDFTEDSDFDNGSSIAFLFELNNQRILFTADSHSSVLVSSLGKKYSKEKPLKLNYMQIAHHGSKYNTSDDLLELIDCENYIISGDGYNKHNLPNKETLVRIIKQNPNRKINFHITHKNDLMESIFNVDGDIENIELKFPTSKTIII